MTNGVNPESLVIRTFGALAVYLGDTSQPIRFATQTVDALLVYLACQGRPVGRDVLAELLWPERTQRQARTNLRVALYRLRAQVDPYLLITRQHIALNPNSKVELDVSRFETHIAVGELASATTLYRGDFLDGFYLDGSPAFEQWAWLERERLRNLALSAYTRLVDQAATADQRVVAVGYAHRLLQLDPLHEPTHRQLMRLLASIGQRSAALGQYETCRRLLASELDAPPDETTIALYERIRSQDQDLGISDGYTPNLQLAAAPPARDFQNAVSNTSSPNLPPQPTPFIGRAVELAQIERLLANPDCRLLTLLGVGGIGKTRLAIEAAQRMQQSVTTAIRNPKSNSQDLSFVDGVYFVSLAPVEKAELVLATIAQSLELQITGRDLQTDLVAYLRQRSLLLVIDNFEHLVEAAEAIAYLLQHAANIKIMVTSRERLYLREEWLLPIAGLALADGLAGEAGQLFLRSAQRVQPDFTGRGQEPTIAAICAHVEGMPLAVELAASWVRAMPVAEIARQITQNLDVFTTTLRNLPERHRSLRNLFDHSWRLLSPLEQGVLRRVSVFRAGWTLEEGNQVAGATLALLIGLVDKSLVRTNGAGRFSLHELVRQYAAEQLVASGEAELIRQRHYAAYLQLFRTGDRQLRGPESAIGFARLDAEQDNLRTALHWALDLALYAEAAWLMAAAHYFWFFYGHKYEATSWLTQLLPYRAALPDDLRLATLIAFFTSGRGLAEFAPSIQHTSEVVQLLEGRGDRLLHAPAWFALWVPDSSSTKIEILERALASARMANAAPASSNELGCLVDRQWVLAVMLLENARFLMQLGEVARAVPLAAESLAHYRAQGNRDGIGDSLGILGRMALLQGDLAQAYVYLHEAVTIAATNNFHMLLCNWQPVLATVTMYRGDVMEARRLLFEVLRVALQIKNRFYVTEIYTGLTEVALCQGKLDEAAQWQTKSLASDFDPHRVEIFDIQRLLIAARLATAQQQFARAAMLFGLVEQAHGRIHNVVGGPPRALAEAALVTVRQALDPVVFAEAFTTGQQQSLSEAFATILAAVHRRAGSNNSIGLPSGSSS